MRAVHHAVDGITGAVLAGALAWYGYHHVGAIHDLVEHAARWWDAMLLA